MPEPYAHENLESELRLAAAVRGLTANQVTLLESMARAMQVPVLISDVGGSDLVDDVFAETMANILTLHHALHEEALSKKAFEYMLKNCLLAQGHTDSELNPSPGAERWDVRGGGQRWSLKTEAAEGISRNQIKIEKLMEARWVRDATTAEICSGEVSQRLPKHMVDYDRILILRAFALAGGYEYHLQEIPKTFLQEAFSTARPQDFAKNGSSISFGANFGNIDGKRVFRILLDSSVEKVRLWYTARAAILHGKWIVNTEQARYAQQNTMAD